MRIIYFLLLITYTSTSAQQYTILGKVVNNNLDVLSGASIKIEETKAARLLVLSVAGLPIGTLDRVDIGKAVLNKIGLNLPDQLIKIARKENIYPIGLNLYDIAKKMISNNLEDDQN